MRRCIINVFRATILTIVLLLLSIGLHEIGHASLAKFLGCDAEIHLNFNSAKTTAVCVYSERGIVRLLFAGGLIFNLAFAVFLCLFESLRKYFPVLLFYSFMLSTSDIIILMRITAQSLCEIMGYVMATFAYLFTLRLQYSIAREYSKVV